MPSRFRQFYRDHLETPARFAADNVAEFFGEMSDLPLTPVLWLDVGAAVGSLFGGLPAVLLGAAAPFAFGIVSAVSAGVIEGVRNDNWLRKKRAEEAGKISEAPAPELAPALVQGVTGEFAQSAQKPVIEAGVKPILPVSAAAPVKMSA